MAASSTSSASRWTTTAASPRWIKERGGEGLHHICYEVDSIDKALAHAQENGAQLRLCKPCGVFGSHAHPEGYVAFLDNDAGGIEIEFMQVYTPEELEKYKRLRGSEMSQANSKTVQVGTAKAEPGTVVRGAIPVMHLAGGSAIEIPVVVINGTQGRPGALDRRRHPWRRAGRPARAARSCCAR